MEIKNLSLWFLTFLLQCTLSYGKEFPAGYVSPKDCSSYLAQFANFKVGVTVLYPCGTCYRKGRVLDLTTTGWALLNPHDSYMYADNLRPYEQVPNRLNIKIGDTVLVGDFSSDLVFGYHKVVVTDITAVGLIETDHSKRYRFSNNFELYLPVSSWGRLKVGDLISQKGRITNISKGGLVEINGTGRYQFLE